MTAIFKRLEWIPILGVFVFFAGHFLAAAHYPGGHQWDYDSTGYNIFLNFWCDLIWPETYNKEPNPASIYGIVTTVFLTLSLVIFFIEFARTIPMSKVSRLIIMLAGSASMISASLIFTEAHTFAIYSAAALGLIALTPMINALVQNRYKTLMIWGGITIAILVYCMLQLWLKFAYIIYPSVQKAAFVIGLTWVIAMCLKIRELKRVEVAQHLALLHEN